MLYCSGAHQYLHAFPTRRSSDLNSGDGKLAGGGTCRAKTPNIFPMNPSGVQLASPMKPPGLVTRSEEHTSELQSLRHLVCRLLLEKKKHRRNTTYTEV